MNAISNPKKLYLLGLFGNIAEWYDFSIYSYMAAVIGQIFFATSTPQLAAIKGFAVFSLSYLARPFGSICFGYIGDKFGRRKSLRLSLMMMAIPAVLIGMLPTYSSIGVLATILLIITRFTQGLAVGGEYPGVACYVYESASPNRKKFFCSIAVASPAIGMLIGSAVVTILYNLLSKELINEWAWRIPFLLSIFVLLFIFYIRKDLEETAEFSQSCNMIDRKNYNKNLFTELLQHKKSFLQGVLIWIFLEISFYLLFVWMPTYLSVFLDFAADKSFFNNSVGLLSMVIITILVGYLAEIKKMQSKNIIIFSLVGIILLAYPLFLLLQLKNMAIIIMVQVIFSIFVGSLAGIAMYTVINLFNARIRCLSIGISVTIASGLFGGMSPTICSYLIHKTGYNLAPVFFLIIAGIIALMSAITLKKEETNSYIPII